jgi:VWFA-related protein
MLQYRHSRAVQVLLTLFVLLAGAISPYAQDVQMVPDQNDREAAEKAQRRKGEEEEPVTTLKARSELVQLFFNVKDKKGGLIASLTKEEFEILDNKQPQTIKYFTASSNLPLTLGIMIDTSLSQQNVLGMEQQVGGAFLGQILTDKDQAFVIDFGVRVSLVQDFTSSVGRLKDALNSVRIDSGGQGAVSGVPGMGGGPVPTMGTPKGTLLYDAVYLASHDQMGQQVDRKALVLLTDGEDQGSQYKVRDAIEAAQKADTIVYVLLCADRGFYWNAGASFGGDSEMKKLTAETGGRVIDVGNKPEKLKAAFQQISDELRSQYNIGYVPLNPKRDGSFHKVEIRSKQGYKVQSRSGYFAIPD